MGTYISASNLFSCKTTASGSHRGQWLLDSIYLEKILFVAMQCVLNILWRVLKELKILIKTAKAVRTTPGCCAGTA